MDINETLQRYIFEEIVPRYGSFDAAHKENHVLTVMRQAMELIDRRDSWARAQENVDPFWLTHVDRAMLLTAAACHDLGLENGRESHHLDSGRIIRSDMRLREWFSEAQIEVIAQAAEDHRASGKGTPRSIYGMLVAEADRVIESGTIIRRALQYGIRNYPDIGREGQIRRAADHLEEKYGRGGYLRLWIPWSDNGPRLNALQELIADRTRLEKEVSRIHDSL